MQANIFSKVIPTYEKLMLTEYTNGKEASMVYENSEEAKLNEHATVVSSTTNKNPYWSLYDMIKHEERDGRVLVSLLRPSSKHWMLGRTWRASETPCRARSETTREQ